MINHALFVFFFNERRIRSAVSSGLEINNFGRSSPSVILVFTNPKQTVMTCKLDLLYFWRIAEREEVKPDFAAPYQ